MGRGSCFRIPSDFPPPFHARESGRLERKKPGREGGSQEERLQGDFA